MKLIKRITNIILSMAMMIVGITCFGGDVSQVFATEANVVSTEKQLATEKLPYYIQVNLQDQVVTVYGLDETGNYTVPVKAMICSTGAATPVSGVYPTSSKYQWHTLFYNVYGQYATRIVGSILFHSVPYAAYGDPSSLITEDYDQLGTAASAGCVRLTVADAKWIYDHCGWGTLVEFKSTSNPSGLSVTAPKKLADVEAELKKWDPTDMVPENPWMEYLGIQLEVYEVRTFAEMFDAEYYAKMNPDVAALVGTDQAALYQHFVQYGKSEGRNATPRFDVRAYKSAYPDLEAVFQNDILSYYNHFEACGQKEGRTLSNIEACKKAGIVVTDFNGNVIG